MTNRFRAFASNDSERWHDQGRELLARTNLADWALRGWSGFAVCRPLDELAHCSIEHLWLLEIPEVRGAGDDVQFGVRYIAR